MLITPEQIRAARALSRIGQTALAQEAGISVITLRRLEDHHGLSNVAPATVDLVRRALEKAGAEFIDRGVRRSVPSPAAIQSIKNDMDRIVMDAAALMARHPPMTEEELYDENGL